MKYRILFTIMLFVLACYWILFFFVWLLIGKWPFGNQIDAFMDKISDKCFAGWNSYYDACEKEFMNNPFVEHEAKEKYKCEGSYTRRKQLLDAYDKDLKHTFDKINKAL